MPKTSAKRFCRNTALGVVNRQRTAAPYLSKPLSISRVLTLNLSLPSTQAYCAGPVG
jgi:hypothetical protein